MNDHEDAPLRYYDRQIADRSPKEPAPDELGCVTTPDLFMLLWPIWLVLLALTIGTPIVALIHGGTTSGHYAAGVALYGGLAAVWLTLPWAAAYLVARLVSLVVGGWPIVAIGLSGLGAASVLVAAGLMGWSSMLIALPSLGALINGAVRVHATR